MRWLSVVGIAALIGAMGAAGQEQAPAARPSFMAGSAPPPPVRGRRVVPPQEQASPGREAGAVGALTQPPLEAVTPPPGVDAGGQAAQPAAAPGPLVPSPGQVPETKAADSENVREIGNPTGPAPQLPVNQYRPKSGDGQKEPIRLDFDNLDLGLVIQMLAPMIGKTFDIDQQVATQKVTVVSHEPIPPDMVYYVLESILASRGMKMVETVGGNLIKIRPIAEDEQDAPMVVDSNAPVKGYDNFSYHIIQVQHADPTEISTLLKDVGSKQARISVYGKTNTLILYDTATGIRNMLELLKAVDIPGYDESVEFFWLKFTRAEVLSQQIEQVLLGGEGQGQPGGPQQVPPNIRTPATLVRAGRQLPGQTTSAVINAPLTLRMVPDERLNGLIVVASQPLMEQVRDLVKKLDTPAPVETNNMHVRELLHADAEAVETALNALVGGVTPRQSGAGGGGGGGAAVATGGGAAQSGQIQPFEKQVTITRYDQTNALLIIASPQDFKVLDNVIAQLDVPARQVHVEAQILEVSINDRYRLAVESGQLTANDYFALNNVVNLANILTQGPLGALQNSNDILNLGIIKDTTKLTIPDGSGGVITQEVPNIPLLLTALESLTALDVLSRPSLTTVDNEEAHILDGQEIPVISGTQRPLDTGGGQFTSNSIFNQTQRQDVGISLTVTPQISEGDYVFLDLEVKVERPIQSTIGLDPNLVGPTLSKSEIKNKVVVRDGSTGVLGGLISESTDRSKSRTPLLGDLPGLGWLFGRKDDQRAKRNLVVLLTPHIIKEGIDFDRTTQAEVDYATKANADVLFEKGFIKKISTKHKLRNDYRPTEAALDEVRAREKFQRGDVSR